MSRSRTRARPTIAPRRAASSAGSSRSIATGRRRRARAPKSRTRRARSSTGATSSTSPSARCLRPLDAKAQGEIADAAKRVSLVTAISPRAILDVVFVVAQIVRLVRRIAEIYGGRPGLFGFIKLARSIGAHIAITGGMAVGDSLLAADRRPRDRLANLGAHGRRRAQRPAHGARGPVRARRLPPRAVLGRQSPRRLRRRAVPVQQGRVTRPAAKAGCVCSDRVFAGRNSQPKKQRNREKTGAITLFLPKPCCEEWLIYNGLRDDLHARPRAK